MNPDSKFSYNTGSYFGVAAKTLGWIATLFGLINTLEGSYTALLLLPVGFILQFTHYRTEFDLQQMLYREGVGFGSFVFGKWKPLAGFDFLFLKHNRYKRTMESRASMFVSSFERYDGYIKLSDGVKLHLLQHRRKEKAMEELKAIARDLKIELRDLTDMKYF